MTLQQEAYSRIDQMTDDGIRILIDIIDKVRVLSVTGFEKDSKGRATETAVDAPLTKEEKRYDSYSLLDRYRSMPRQLRI